MYVYVHVCFYFARVQFIFVSFMRLSMSCACNRNENVFYGVCVCPSVKSKVSSCAKEYAKVFVLQMFAFM